MPEVSKEQIAQAKEIDLLSYLQAYEPGAIRKSAPNEYCLVEHDSFKISNGRWHWFSRGFGGKTALDYLIHVCGVKFVEAVRILCDGRPAPMSYSQPVNPVSARQKPEQPFTLPTPYRDNFRAIAYLQSRGIDSDIIYHCINAGTLYESKKYNNCTFIGRDINGKARFACVRGTTSNFRQDIEGSDKRYSFHISSNAPDARFILIAEAPIDVLSLATLRKMDTDYWDKYHYLSLGGTSPLALVQYLTDYSKIDHIILALDNDTAGHKGMEKIKEAVHTDEKLAGRILHMIAEPPPVGKDFNDTLLAVIQKQREQTKPDRQKQTGTSI